jgi:hypothetical protein
MTVPEVALRPRAHSLAALSLIAMVACDPGPGPSGACSDGAIIDDGACLEDVGLYYQPCSGKVVAELPLGDCPAQHCARTAYAVCNGREWGACVCSIPSGYEVVDAGFFGPEGGSEGSAEP